MRETEKILFLNKILLDEMPQYREEAAGIPPDRESRRYLLRCLMNVRQPRALSESFLRAQDTLQ